MSKKSPKMLHYVPKAYLRGFSSRGGSYIWCFDKKQNRSYEPNLNGVAVERDFYLIKEGKVLSDLAVIGSAKGLDVETFLSKLEGQFPVVRDSLINAASKNGPVHHDYIDFLSDYIHFQLHRTYDLKESIKDTYLMSGISVLQLANSITTPTERISEEGIIEVAHRSALNISEDSELRIEILFDKKLYSLVKNRLLSMSWTILSSENASFITSDNPILRLSGNENKPHGLGLGDPDLELYFPLTPKYALVLNDPRFHVRNQLKAFNVMKIADEYVYEYNRLQVIRANKQVFSSRDIDSYCKKIMKGKVNAPHAIIHPNPISDREGRLVEASESFKYILLDAED